MKTLKVSFLTLIFALAASTVLFVGCDPEEEAADKTELATAIADAKALIASSSEGTAEGQYLLGSQDVFQAVITTAEVVNLDPLATQTDVDNTVIALAAATTLYGTKIVAAIAPDSLVGHWTFDDGTGTTLSDFSGSEFHGTLMSGADTWGGGLPTWTTDRYGNAGGALAFDLGAFVKIPFNAALNPGTMSVSVWVNTTEMAGNNRFMGLHSWNGYKFQLQDANKSFFTIATTDGIWDRDTDPPLALDTWYNLAVTFGGGNMKFYINGTETMVWDNTPGTAEPNTGNDLVFGRGSDVYAAVDTNYDNDKIIPMAWGGYFRGAMDEIRIYNSVLTAAQVQSIYELEKVAE